MLLVLLLLGRWLAGASAAVHNLFVGNIYDPYSVYLLSFDDATNDLRIIKNNTADASHAWIALDNRKANLYGASLNETRYSSYRITPELNLDFTRSIKGSSTCFNKTSAFIEASPWPPYTVYAVSFPGPQSCGVAISVDESGTLEEVISTWLYANESSVHGLALARRESETFVYAADMKGNSVWTHRVSRQTGEMIEVGRKVMTRKNMEPRHLTLHPKGTYVYVVMEAANSLVAFGLDGVSGATAEAGVEHSLLPEGSNNTEYWSAEVKLSPSSRYLWATARARIDTDHLGYISCFLLDDNGTVVKRMFMVPTTTTGGWANGIQPASWSDEYAAMTDTPTGYVQVWKMEGRKETSEGVEYESARAVARVDMAEGGCCANAVWYS